MVEFKCERVFDVARDGGTVEEMSAIGLFLGVSSDEVAAPQKLAKFQFVSVPSVQVLAWHDTLCASYRRNCCNMPVFLGKHDH
jgi:hypothetical protein